MGRNIFANITLKGTVNQFKDRMSMISPIWERFCTRVPSTASSETHVWIGRLPDPREYISGRNLQGIRDFTYNLKNKEYELSFLIDRNSVEDQQHGEINQVIATAADTWAAYKDVLFAAAINNGGTTGYNSFDGVTFFNDTHVIGAASPDNNLASSSPSDAEALTVAEMKVELRTCLLALQGFTDDTGRAGFNWAAMQQQGGLVAMGNQQFQQSLVETINATLTGGGDSNPFFQNLADPIINPYLGVTNDYLYMAVVGDPMNRPFIYQERTPLEINVHNDQKTVDDEHGVLVYCRQRFRLGYGDPRRMVRNVLT